MNGQHRLLRRGLLGTAALAISISPFWTTVSVANESSFALEEITVTARRLEERLQSTPVSVTVVTNEMIDRMSITNIREIENITPNLQFSPSFSGSGGAANFFIRGIGQADFVSTSDPGVAVFIDGVYMARTVGSAIDSADVARIEVLKGPQGTLFGKNTIGGAVNITTAKPDHEARGYVEATAGRFGRFDGRFMANVPISDTFFVKLTGVTRNNDGFQERITDGVMLGNDNTVGGSIQARWLPSDALDIVLSADVTRRRANIAAQTGLAVGPGFLTNTYIGVTGVDPQDSVLPSDPVRQSSSGVRPTDDMNVFGTSLNINYDFGDMALRSITAYREMKSDSGTDFDGTDIPFNDQLVNQIQEQYSQEFQLSQQTDRFKWLLGAFYMRENTEDLITNNFVLFYTDPPLGVNAPVGDGPVQNTDLKTDNFALFGQGTYFLTEQLSLTAGVRWTYEKKNISIQAPFGLNTSGDPLDVDGRKSWNNISPRLGIEYQASDDLLVYASVTRGFKSGSYSGRPDRNESFQPFDPEKVWAYEVGFKSEFADNRIRLNGSAFWTKYKGIQLSIASQDALGRPFFPISNAGNVDIRGLELELLARPIEPLTLFANIGMTDEKWQRIAAGAPVNENSRLPFMSHFTAVVGGDYAVPLADFGSLTLGGHYSYRDKYHMTTGNSPLLLQEGFGLLEARAIIEPESGNWQLRFWGKNLTNKEYKHWGQDLFSGGSGHLMAFFGRPREYGVTFRVNL